MADQDTPSQANPVKVVGRYEDGIRPAGVSKSVADGRKVVTTAGTRVQFDALDCRSVAFTADAANVGTVVIGGPTCVAAAGTRQGTPLAAGDTAIFSVWNMNVLFMDATTSGEGVSYTVLA